MRHINTATSLLALMICATSACAQPTAMQSTQSSPSASAQNNQQAASASADTAGVDAATEAHLRRVLTETGIKTQIAGISHSKLPNMYQVDLVGQPPLHISADGYYVIQGQLRPNPSKASEGKIPTRSRPEQAGQPVNAAMRAALLANTRALKNTSAQTPFYYTAVPGVIWGATLEGVPFLLSDDGRYLTDGEISVIENGQFMGLDTNFEQRKNQSVFATLDESQLISYPATTREKAVVYVATDVNCPYCRLFHQQVARLNRQGVTVHMIGYPIYEQSPEQMRGIWCQADDNARRKALDAAMLTGKMTPAPANCQTDPITPNRNTAAGLAVMATPAIYREDGALYQASFESPEFLAFLGIE